MTVAAEVVAHDRPRHRRWPLLALAVVVVAAVTTTMLVRSGGARARTYDSVDAVVGRECAHVSAQVDGLHFESDLPRDPVTNTVMPPFPTLRGQTVHGRMTVTRVNDVQATGVFTTADGTTIELVGGVVGKVFFTLGCGLWSA